MVTFFCEYLARISPIPTKTRQYQPKTHQYQPKTHQYQQKTHKKSDPKGRLMVFFCGYPQFCPLHFVEQIVNYFSICFVSTFPIVRYVVFPCDTYICVSERFGNNFFFDSYLVGITCPRVSCPIE